MENILDLKDHEEFIKDNRWRSKAAVVVLLVTIFVCFIALLMYLSQYEMLTEHDGRVYPQRLANNHLGMGIVSLLETLISLANWIFLIMWFRRAYCNLYRVGVPHLDSPEGLAAGAWFIPVYNLFKPFSIMREICDNTTHYVQKSDPSFDSAKPQSVIGWWWAVYVLSFIASILAYFLRPENAHLSSQLMFTEYSIGLKCIEIVSTVLLIVVIRRLFPFEEALKNKQEEIHAGFNVYGDAKTNRK